MPPHGIAGRVGVMTDTTHVTVERTIEAPVSTPSFDVLSTRSGSRNSTARGSSAAVDHADRIQKVGGRVHMNMEGEHMGGQYQTDNHVTGTRRTSFCMETAPPAPSRPVGVGVGAGVPGSRTWTLVRHTYGLVPRWRTRSCSNRSAFPLVTEQQLEDTLGRLAAASHGPVLSRPAPVPVDRGGGRSSSRGRPQISSARTMPATGRQPAAFGATSPRAARSTSRLSRSRGCRQGRPPRRRVVRRCRSWWSTSAAETTRTVVAFGHHRAHDRRFSWRECTSPSRKSDLDPSDPHRVRTTYAVASSQRDRRCPIACGVDRVGVRRVCRDTRS